MFFRGVSRAGVYFCLRGVWSESGVHLGLVEGMWTLESDRLEFKSCLCRAHALSSWKNNPGQL